MTAESAESPSFGTCAGCGRDVVDQGQYVGADLYHPTCVHLAAESATVQELRAALMAWRERYARLEERVETEKAEEILKRRAYRDAVLESVSQAVRQSGLSGARRITDLIETMKEAP